MTSLSTIEKRIGNIESARGEQDLFSHMTKEEFLEYLNDVLVQLDAGFQMKSLFDYEDNRRFDAFVKQFLSTDKL
ncbi:MAG: hypothetical protein GY761_16255 [Hyphomicrobiales bacterium]|nr:hypothetical protein [Hyphomicrobiales bacterium]